MNTLTDRLIGAAAIACGFCVLFALLNRWLLFGTMAWILITLWLALGLGRASSERIVLTGLALIFLSYTALLFAMYWLHDPRGDPIMLFGFPVGSGLVVYGIWPLGMVPSFLYAVIFDRWILPRDRLDRFLDEFGPRGTGS